ncbi:hypothetical protein EW145_g3166 [Phellinidium pouzarii]|uniref:Uncharacterized protein n=1 Tax=Phellinidium pouzarii TaxID=167371 RepID=A0A4S4L8J8_9AGAM|nr:hypothetical protein EW145_g3166 [Phellinidium pouzarii]
MLYFSSTGFLVHDEFSPSPEWILPSLTGIIADLNIGSPAMQWPYFSPAERIINGHFGSSTPTSPPRNCAAVASSLSSPSLFDDFEYPLANHGTSAVNHGISAHQGTSPSLVNHYHSTGDAQASPSLSWDAIDVNSNISAIELIQRVTTVEDVQVVVSAISTWASRLSWSARDAQLLPFRLAAARLFSGAWDPAYGNLFLDFDENDVFITKKYLPLTYMDHDQTQRLINTTRATVVAFLYGRLLEVNILTSADVVVACEMLLEHHHMHGYMLGLWELLSFAGDKVCRKATVLRMQAIQRELRKVKRNSSLYEVEHYADIIVRLIDDFVVVQNEKTKATLPKGKKERRRRSGKLRKVSEKQRKRTR